MPGHPPSPFPRTRHITRQGNSTSRPFLTPRRPVEPALSPIKTASLQGTLCGLKKGLWGAPGDERHQLGILVVQRHLPSPILRKHGHRTRDAGGAVRPSDGTDKGPQMREPGRPPRRRDGRLGGPVRRTNGLVRQQTIDPPKSGEPIQVPALPAPGTPALPGLVTLTTPVTAKHDRPPDEEYTKTGRGKGGEPRQPIKGPTTGGRIRRIHGDHQNPPHRPRDLSSGDWLRPGGRLRENRGPVLIGEPLTNIIDDSDYIPPT